jgi:hypothetical protein
MRSAEADVSQDEQHDHHDADDVEHVAHGNPPVRYEHIVRGGSLNAYWTLVSRVSRRYVRH